MAAEGVGRRYAVEQLVSRKRRQRAFESKDNYTCSIFVASSSPVCLTVSSITWM